LEEGCKIEGRRDRFDFADVLLSRPNPGRSATREFETVARVALLVKSGLFAANVGEVTAPEDIGEGFLLALEDLPRTRKDCLVETKNRLNSVDGLKAPSLSLGDFLDCSETGMEEELCVSDFESKETSEVFEPFSVLLRRDIDSGEFFLPSWTEEGRMEMVGIPDGDNLGEVAGELSLEFILKMP
jgi:hypothetical protein